jgi:pyridoxine 5-phosphate synthase
MRPQVLLPRLGVNVDHVATIRQARQTTYPNPVWAATLAELGGADQITIHLRQDERHIVEKDLYLLRQTVGTRLNLEMAAVPEMLTRAFESKPDRVTLVPERRQEVTTEGGLDVASQRDAIKAIVKELKGADIPVSLFIDPDPEQVREAKRVEADAVEIHTGRYCDAKTAADREEELTRVIMAAKGAAKVKLKVYGGHGLNYDNVGPIAAIDEMEELNIGHAIVARAVLVGMQAAVREMKDLLWRARQDAVHGR